MRRVKIANRYIGDKYPCFIIAEIGSNHNQDLGTVYRLVDAAKDAGADAVKFQSFTFENWISKDMTSFPTVPKEENLKKLLKRCELPYPMYKKIKEYARRKNIICFSTPSHIRDIDKLLSIGVPAFKFGSVQITDIPTIAYAAGTGKPIIISAGASTMQDIKAAVDTIKRCGNRNIILLHCTSLYPAPFDALNLNLIKILKEKFDCPVGFSDHTTDPVTAPIAAAALGACVIEKHITLSRKMRGPDHKFALEPKEFEMMVRAVRDAESALGSCTKKILPAEKEIAKMGRRSVVAETDIPKGAKIIEDMLTLKRPGTGISPKYIGKVIGRRAKKDIKKDTVITWEKV